ncbi:MAG TPA: hypothetical protein VFA18_09430, partial [Gemmataceae bacterium]|nr:hypothetical protein [Gemmataceae bacterium]
IEKPLWVLLGTTVSKKRPNERDTSQAATQERTDVAEVVAFLRRFLEEPAWAIERIAQTAAGESGFEDKETRQDLFRPHLDQLPRTGAEALYRQICRDLFHGQGGLEVWQLKESGEVALRVASGGQKELPYFAVINIGDVASFKKHLEERLDLEVKEDRFTPSLFPVISEPDSPINMLVGAKKFIEGWSSWRVSAMGLLNVGTGEGSQVIQLFGRGVRLKGRNKSLQRSEGEPGTPEGLKHLETLYIFGWNADYLELFRQTLAKEDLSRELPPLRVPQRQPWPDWLWVPARAGGYNPKSETWIFDDSGARVTLDLRPQVTAVTGVGTAPTTQAGLAGIGTVVRFNQPAYANFIDADALATDLIDYKCWRNYGNVFIPRPAVRRVLERCCEIKMLQEDAASPDRLQRAAATALKTYLDRLVRRCEREAESDHAEPAPLDRESQVVAEYRITVHAADAGIKLFREIEALLQKPIRELCGDDGEPLPRLYLDWHLFNPLLLEGGKEWREYVDVRPPALVRSEYTFVRSLRQFWQANHDKMPYAELEVYLLRNLPKVGVGLFSGSGFYPDFILWLRNRTTGAIHVRLLDPHGLHHGGLEGSADKFEALKKLKELSLRTPFVEKQLTIDGFLLAPAETSTDDIPGAAGRTWEELEGQYPLLHQEGDYIERVVRLEQVK